MALKLYPIGIQTFERIRKDDRLYVDKTEYVYRMTHNNYTYVFLGRPRRFGKSLLVSTLESYFEGKNILCCTSTFRAENTRTRRNCTATSTLCLEKTKENSE